MRMAAKQEKDRARKKAAKAASNASVAAGKQGVAMPGGAVPGVVAKCEAVGVVARLTQVAASRGELWRLRRLMAAERELATCSFKPALHSSASSWKKCLNKQGPQTGGKAARMRMARQAVERQAAEAAAEDAIVAEATLRHRANLARVMGFRPAVPPPPLPQQPSPPPQPQPWVREGGGLMDESAASHVERDATSHRVSGMTADAPPVKARGGGHGEHKKVNKEGGGGGTEAATTTEEAAFGDWERELASVLVSSF